MATKEYWQLQEILKNLEEADKPTLLAVKTYIEVTLSEDENHPSGVLDIEEIEVED